MPNVNPNILKWARETAGLTLQEAASELKLQDARGKTGAARLQEYEDGKASPNRSLLVKMSQKYRRSLLVFYLSEPPATGDRGQDFRNLPSDIKPFDADLDALIRNIKVRQSLVKSLLEDEEAPIRGFIASAKIEDGFEKVAQSITKTLNFRLDEYRARKNITEAFNYLRDLVEMAGIFVLLVGDLGSHHSKIPVETFRGFAIADPIAPFVVINDHDAKAAWSFTILHEVAHLWLGTTGVSSSSDKLLIEKFCNEVAGLILLPPDDLKQLQNIQNSPFNDALTNISLFAKNRNISKSMVAYKLFKMKQIPEKRWQALEIRFRQDWQEQVAREKAKAKESKGGGPSFYVVRRHRLGQALLEVVSRSINQGNVSPTKAGKILGVKPRNVEHLLNPRLGGT